MIGGYPYFRKHPPVPISSPETPGVEMGTGDRWDFSPFLGQSDRSKSSFLQPMCPSKACGLRQALGGNSCHGPLKMPIFWGLENFLGKCYFRYMYMYTKTSHYLEDRLFNLISFVLQDAFSWTVGHLFWWSRMWTLSLAKGKLHATATSKHI